jgi:hypothetical protein
VPEKRPGNSQGLSRTALAAKRARDLAAAKTKKRKDRKAQNQRIGQKSDSDLHHTSSGTVRRVSIAYNRATHDRNEVKT